MIKIGVIGGRDSIYGFAALGLDIFPAEDAKQAGELLMHLADHDYGVLYITEKLASQLSPELEALSERTLPAVIPIPGVSCNTGIGMANVKKSVERAVGSDILFGS
jgi:Archaeal/vacuolar-type H+-ATPase subunit F